MLFKNRVDAGRKLVQKLLEYKGTKNTIVLGLPRGGVVVAFEIAMELGLPLDIIVPRKIGAPGNPEYAIGAVTETGEAILDEAAIDMTKTSKSYIEKETEKQQSEAARRITLYRKGKAPLSLEGVHSILVDDGIATGLTMLAAIKSAQEKGAVKITVATPVASKEALEKIEREADSIVCLETPEHFLAIGEFYDNFAQTSDEEVVRLLAKPNPSV